MAKFKFYNRNPNDELLPDCVIRAISLALDVPYFDVAKMIIDNADANECNELTVDCYSNIFKKLHFKHYTPNGFLRVEDVAYLFNDKIVLIRIKGHLTCAKYGIIYDIWDCSEKVVTDFWIVGR